MSKDCITCRTEPRNGPDLLCDYCRGRIRVIKDEKGRPCLIVGGKEHTMDHHSMMELIKEASESVGYDVHAELVRVRSKCAAPALFQLEKIRTEQLAAAGLFCAANAISHARVALGDAWPLASQERHGYADELEDAKDEAQRYKRAYQEEAMKGDAMRAKLADFESPPEQQLNWWIEALQWSLTKLENGDNTDYAIKAISAEIERLSNPPSPNLKIEGECPCGAQHCCHI